MASIKTPGFDSIKTPGIDTQGFEFSLRKHRAKDKINQSGLEKKSVHVVIFVFWLITFYVQSKLI